MFEFPDPVNETSARVVAGGVVAMTAATLLFDEPTLMFPITYGFLARTLNGPRFSPLGLLATKVITPRLPLEDRFVPGLPKRIAQGTGFLISASATVLLHGFGRKRAAYRVLTVLLAAASLEAFFGICVACRLFSTAARAGLLPESVCADCLDLSSRLAGNEGEDLRAPLSAS